MESSEDEKPDPQTNDAGGIGGNLFIKPENERSDTKIIERAIRNDWPIPASIRNQIVNRMSDIVGTSPEERNQIAAARVIVAADGVNVRREALDQKEQQYREPHPQTILHEHSGSIDLVPVRQQLLSQPDFIDYARTKPIDVTVASSPVDSTDMHAGPVCGNGEPGPVEASPPLNGHRSGHNGYDHGTNGTGASH